MPNAKAADDSAGGLPAMALDLPCSATPSERRAHVSVSSCLRRVACTIAAGALVLRAVWPGCAFSAEILRLNCTNMVSGASFPVAVDLDRGRVDALAATITDKWISWHDPKQGFFDLDRATGKLRLRNASSTGGYFLYYTCRPQQ